MSDTNKVKYGLKNVHYAKCTIGADGTATYGTVKPWPGAVNLSLDAQGGTTKFRADNINYWVGQSNNGYEGDLESAKIPDDFRVDILGDVQDANGALVEDVEAKTTSFALLFQFEGDINATRHVMYNCTATRPSVSGATTEEEIEPQTETITITSSSIYNSSLQKNISRAKVAQSDSPYDTWFDSVYQPAAGATTYSVTQTLTHTTSTYTDTTVDAGDDFTATLEAEDTYTLGTVTVTMGGVDITSLAWDSTTSTVTIASVTGNIVITATSST